MVTNYSAMSVDPNQLFSKPMSSATDPTAANYMGRVEQQYTPSISGGGGAVLGTVDEVKSPAPSGGGGNGNLNMSDYNKTWYYNEFGQPTAIGGSDGGPNINQMVEEAYGGLMSSFGEQESLAKQGAESSKTGIQEQYLADTKSTQSELEKLLRDIDLNRSKLQESGSAALDDSARSYRALEQRANVRYGGGSGLGDLMRELAAKELYRSQGGIRKEQLAGEKDIVRNITDTNLFFEDKRSKLELWRNQAIREVENNLNSILANISAQKGMAQRDKDLAKIDALNKARSDAQGIRMADVQFRGELFNTYLANMQEQMGRTFTPEEIADIYSKFNSPVFSPYAQASGQAPYVPGAGRDEDELNQLMPGVA